MHLPDGNKAAIRRSIASLRSRPYGWDGDDALPARPDALLSCLALFDEESALRLDGLEPPEVRLVEDGTIEVAFGRDGRTLVLQFVSNRVVTFVQGLGDGEATIEGVIRYDRPDDCRRLAEVLNWIGAEA